MTKGVCLARSMFIDSMVCGSSPCMMSITRMAMSQSEEPRERRFEKDSWPGVSMMSKPGTRTATLFFASSEPIRSQSVSFGKKEAPICWVMPPASPSCTFVRRMLSSSLVLPVSTWPMMQQMGERSRSGVRAAIAALVRASRSSLAAALPASSSSSDESSPDSSSSSSSSFSLSSASCAARSICLARASRGSSASLGGISSASKSAQPSGAALCMVWLPLGAKEKKGLASRSAAGGCAGGAKTRGSSSSAGSSCATPKSAHSTQPTRLCGAE
mmetsp:Transcript_18311/g.58967  ORF Transcript_18311/g.58967 Transcript_18311/m.58967 type:complete len:272 (+) Transcript_18311:226-1041(+)